MLKHQLLTEVLWLLIAAVTAILIVSPPVVNVGEFQFQSENALVIFGFVTLLRLIFFHKQSPWLQHKAMKAVACVAMIPAVIFSVLTINTVQTFVDANGYAALFSTINTDAAILWGEYIRNEVIFFGAGLIICALILPAMLIIEVWRQVKGYS